MGNVHLKLYEIGTSCLSLKEKVCGWTDKGQRPITIAHLR